jgi:hypothetical protein
MRLNPAQANARNLSSDKSKDGFESASIVLPVINEVESLNRIVDIIFENNKETIREVLIIVCHKTTNECLSACNTLRERYAGKIRVIRQNRPLLGGALQEGLLAARASHVIVMYSDGESNPLSVNDLIRTAQQNPQAIISASRWLKGSSFQGYSQVKLVVNFLFQKVFALFYWRNITDFTFGYRIYPVPLVQAIEWKETGHSFVFESILKPLRLNVRILEIPTIWKARSEGQSQLKFYMYIRYLWVGLKLRLSRKNSWGRSLQ